MVKIGFDPNARGDQLRLDCKTKILPRRHERTLKISSETLYVKHLFGCLHIPSERLKVEDVVI